MSLRNNEKGMALLVVLVIVTLLTALLTELAFSTMVELRLVETFRDSTRAYYLAKGGVNAGRMILQDDRNNFDSFSEPWSQGVANYPVGEGAVSVRIADLDGKLGINAMVMGDTPRAIMVDRFYRLLITLDLGGGADPAELTAALIDWMDRGDQPYRQILTDGVDIPVEGAEVDFYQRLPDPYRIKNGPIETLEELTLIKGFSAQVVEKLRPFISIHDQVSVNINTAAPEVLLSLDAEISLEAVEDVINLRKAAPIKEVRELEPILGQQDYSVLKTLANINQIATMSRFFRIEADAVVNDGRRRLVAEVDKSDNSLIFFKVN
jgi:general secretion pathway protein K